jgi:putative transposase
MKEVKYKKTSYPSDLTDEQWEKIAGYFPMGNKGEIHKRSLVEAVLHLVDNGCKWRAMPYDFPKWSTVKSFYYRAVEKGTWEKVMQYLAIGSPEPWQCALMREATAGATETLI